MGNNTAEEDYNRYLETGMLPIVGVCAHGPDAKTLSEITYKDMVAHGFGNINIPAGPVGEDGKNIKPKKNIEVKSDSKKESIKKKHEKTDKLSSVKTEKILANKEITSKLDDLEVKLNILSATVSRLASDIQKFFRDNAY